MIHIILLKIILCNIIDERMIIMKNKIISVWDACSQPPEFPTLEKSEKTDVLIIGGGIAGILTAYFLQERKINYILAEKDRICRGTTHCTTAKITSQHGFIYQKLLKSYGIEKTQMYLSANQKAVKEYEKLCRNIDCDFEKKDNYVFSTRNRDKVEKEFEALQKIKANAQLCDRLEIPLKTEGAIKFSNQAQFNPLKFLYHIAENLNIYENTFITGIDENTAYFDKGKITAKKIIVTSHFPFINRHGSYPLKLYQHRSYVIALENAQKLDGMYVDEYDKGLSFRNYKNIMFLGGGGHRTGKKGGNWNELRAFAEEHYPHATEKYFWATQDCMSLDNIPYIENYSASTPDLFVASGFNKWGMTSSMVAAKILCDTICEKRNEYSEVFSPSRSILKPQLVVNGVESAVNLLTPTTKRCSHLGCALKWNKTEHTWDCPCHGSRYEENGEVINNPAMKNI